jgi:hypothetical protein
LIFFLWSNFVTTGIERIKLSTASSSRRVCTRFDYSSIATLVDVDGSTFATAPNKFVTFSSGTLVFVTTKFDQRKKIIILVKDKRNKKN